MSSENGRARAWRLDGHETPVRFARRVTAETLADWRLDDWIDMAILVVSELVTNALQYGSPPWDLRLSLIDSTGETRPSDVQIDVLDTGARLPERREGSEDGGFGLQVAEALTELSVHPRPTGKTVRALLRLNDVGPEAPALVGRPGAQPQTDRSDERRPVWT